MQVWGKTGGKLYGQRSGADYSDNQKRFVLFNKAAIEALTALPFSPGEDCVVVANDWHTAMFPVLLKVNPPGLYCQPQFVHKPGAIVAEYHSREQLTHQDWCVTKTCEHRYTVAILLRFLSAHTLMPAGALCDIDNILSLAQPSMQLSCLH